MRRSSIFVLAFVLLLFFGLQGWMLLREYWFPIEVQSERAVLEQKSLDVGTPVAGIVWDVRVEEGELVQRGDYLFIVIPQTPTEPQGSDPVFIPALRGGIVMDMTVVPGDFVQASERLGSIVDTDPSAHSITAVLPVTPKQWLQLKPLLRAVVESVHLEDGRPLRAAVTSVSPLYDAKEGTAEVKLQVERIAAMRDWVPSTGMPVQVSLALENTSAFRGWVKETASKIAPLSFAGSDD